MRKINVILAALIVCTGTMAQKKFGEAKYTQMCSYYGETVTGDIHAFDSDKSTEQVVQQIMGTIGLKSNFELRAANVPNAASVIIKGKRYILYNPKFMSQINTSSGSNWAAVSILAHEIGHHLSGHTLDNVGSRPATELEADEFSGFVLCKLGASLKDAQAVMEPIASLKGSHTHPPKRDRLVAIEAGWKRAGGSAYSAPIASSEKPKAATAKATVSSPKARQTTAQRTTPVNYRSAAKETPKQNNHANTNNRQYSDIASYAYFSTNPGAKYYLTTKGSLVLVDKEKVYLIASLAKSNKLGYELMLTDNEDTFIYIGSEGSLINNSGKKVGYLKAR